MSRKPMSNREIDALVAEKVFGVEKYWTVMFGGSHYGSFESHEKAKVRAIKIQGDFNAQIIPMYDEPRYSTDMAAAWTVVEKMRDRGFQIFEISIDGTDGYCAGFSVTWPCAGDGFSKSAPMAICTAALEAVGVEVPLGL